jgi:hypothetical protein
MASHFENKREKKKSLLYLNFHLFIEEPAFFMHKIFSTAAGVSVFFTLNFLV